MYIITMAFSCFKQYKPPLHIIVKSRVQLLTSSCKLLHAICMHCNSCKQGIQSLQCYRTCKQHKR